MEVTQQLKKNVTSRLLENDRTDLTQSLRIEKGKDYEQVTDHKGSGLARKRHTHHLSCRCIEF